MEYDLNRHGSLAEAIYPASDPRPPTDGTSVNVVAFWLKESPWIDFEIHLLLDDEAWGSCGVRVMFPDESRSMLEFLSWKQGVRVVDTLVAIGTAYVVLYLVETVERQNSSAEACATARLPREICIPLGYFREKLEEVRTASCQHTPCV